MNAAAVACLMQGPALQEPDFYSESRRLQLNPEDIATAEACGVIFLPATPAQVQRLSMQRKIFYAAGQPILATRGDGLFETAGTLQRVIEEGSQQQRDLAAWQQKSIEPAVPENKKELDPEEFSAHISIPHTEHETVKARTDFFSKSEQIMPSKRARHSRRPASLPASWALEERANIERDPLPVVALEKLSEVPAATQPGTQRGQRWRVAGAMRRGRAEKHWSHKQR